MKKKLRPKKLSLLWRIARDAEQAAIHAAIATHGTRERAAVALGVTTVTLRTKLEK